MHLIRWRRPTSRVAACLARPPPFGRHAAHPPPGATCLRASRIAAAQATALAAAEVCVGARRAVETPHSFRPGPGMACGAVPRRPQAGHNDCGWAASWASHPTAAVPPHVVLYMPPTLRRRLPRRAPEAAGQGMRSDSRTYVPARGANRHPCRYSSHVYILTCPLALG
jgi:hypothetical protein